MPHGQPDYGPQAVKTTVFGQADLAETAGRLGSIVTFDRRGDVIYLDDFEQGEGRWQRFVPGADGYVDLSSITCRSGGLSMAMAPSSVIGNVAWMRCYFPYPVLSKMGMEISFSYNGSLSPYLFHFILSDPPNSHEAQVRYTQATQILEINDNGVWRTVLTRGILTHLALFNTIKIVVDFTTDRWVRLISNENNWDLSAYSLLAGIAAGVPRLESYFHTTALVAGLTPAYWDDLIITQNEP